MLIRDDHLVRWHIICIVIYAIAICSHCYADITRRRAQAVIVHDETVIVVALIKDLQLPLCTLRDALVAGGQFRESRALLR